MQLQQPPPGRDQGTHLRPDPRHIGLTAGSGPGGDQVQPAQPVEELHSQRLTGLRTQPTGTGTGTADTDAPEGCQSALLNGRRTGSAGMVSLTASPRVRRRFRP